MRGKVNAITLDQCSRTGLLFEAGAPEAAVLYLGCTASLLHLTVGSQAGADRSAADGCARALVTLRGTLHWCMTTADPVAAPVRSGGDLRDRQLHVGGCAVHGGGAHGGCGQVRWLPGPL